MQKTIINTDNFSTKKINVNVADSARDYAISASNSTILSANPSGSIRNLNIDPFFNLNNATVTQSIYGSNLKLTVGTASNTASSNTNVVTAINCYSLVNNPGGGTLAISNNRGLSANADVGSNLPGVTITNNTAIYVDSVPSRGTTTITNAYGIYVLNPNHGTNRYGIYLAAVTGGTVAWSLYNVGSQFNVGTVNASQFKLNSLNTAPASATDTGTVGEIRVDANFIYCATATNTWKRATLSTW